MILPPAHLGFCSWYLTSIVLSNVERSVTSELVLCHAKQFMYNNHVKHYHLHFLKSVDINITDQCVYIKYISVWNIG